MPKAKEIANELRQLADALDKEPDAPAVKPYLYFTHYGTSEKAAFLALAKAFPRPFEKIYKDQDVRLEYSTKNIDITARIDRNAVCRIVEPAKPAVYDCLPLLSEAEEKALEE